MSGCSPPQADRGLSSNKDCGTQGIWRSQNWDGFQKNGRDVKFGARKKGIDFPNIVSAVFVQATDSVWEDTQMCPSLSSMFSCERFSPSQGGVCGSRGLGMVVG